MKKLLIGTSALVAAAAFSGAAVAAEPIKLSVGGYGGGYVVYASQKDSFLKATGTESNAVDVKGDNEVHFKGKTTLDNGLTVSVVYEFEAGGADQGNINDEWTIATSGAFGTVQLAANDTAADALKVNGPGVGDIVLGGAYDNDIIDLIILAPSGFGVTTGTASKPISADAESVTYFTPNIYGFTGGVSYHPSASLSNDNGAPASNNTAGNGSNDAYTVGLKWEGSFSGIDLAVGAGWGTADPNVSYDANIGAVVGEDSHHEWNTGARVGYKGFALGGSYRKVDADNFNKSANQSKNLDKDTWEVGVSYTAAPYAVSLNYQTAEAQNAVTSEGKDKFWQLQLSGQYTMGPGVALEAAVAYAELKDGKYNDAATLAADKDKYKNAGWIVGTGISLTF